MRLGYQTGAAVGLLVAFGAVGVWRGAAGAPPRAKAQALIKRGEYLVNVVARCGDCHTPRTARGKPDARRHLQGGKLWFRPRKRVGEWEDEAPDLTARGKAGRWSEKKMIRFLSTGKKSDAPMPAYRLTVEDARAVTAYLRSLPGKPGKKKKGKRKDDEDEEEDEDEDD
jgi:mono/diheme cytochrome c family protein